MSYVLTFEVHRIVKPKNLSTVENKLYQPVRPTVKVKFKFCIPSVYFVI